MRIDEIQIETQYAVTYESILRACILKMQTNPGLAEYYGLDRETLLDRCERGEITGLAVLFAMACEPGELLARMIAGRDAKSYRLFPVTVLSLREPYRARTDGVTTQVLIKDEPLQLLMHYSALQCTWDEWLLQLERERMKADERKLARLNNELRKLT